jgi:competence protein ComEC
LRLWAGIRAEAAAQVERWLLWSPVAFGCGCALFFALTFEPSPWAVYGAAAAAATAALLARRTRRRGLAIGLALLAFFVSGLAASELRAQRVAAPIAPANLGARRVEAWVVDNANNTSDRGRVLLAPIRIDGLGPKETPIRMRLTLRGPPPAPGAAIEVMALVNPPPAPASPGAYDFARDAYFQSVGAVGLALGQPKALADPDPPPLGLKRDMAVNAWRWRLAETIIAAIGDRYGGLVVSMTTGHQAWIREEDLQSFRDSGLAHLLSISGVHMAIVGGFVYFLTRLLIACWPWLALRVSGKKAAAGIGIAAIGAYLIVSGSPAPAERSAVTAITAFGAILLDRRAISFNSLAVAAFFVLVRHPEQIVQPGFQMSFAATAALVGLAEVWPHRTKEISTPWPILLVQKFKDWLVAGLMVSLVAGSATGPFAIQHFNRISNYGLLANAIESPISSFITMPFLAVGAALATVGLGKPFLAVAGWGVSLTLAVSDWVAKLPGAIMVIPSAPAIALVVSFLGLLFACLWKGRLRWLGIPVAAAVLVWPRPEPPLVWIASDGTNAVVRDARQGVVLRPDAKAFAVNLWTMRRGITPEGAKTLGAHFDCDRKGCAPLQPVSGVKVGGWWWKKPPPAERADTLCRASDLVIFRGPMDQLPASCAGKLALDGVDFTRGGAVELWRRGGRWLAVWNRDVRGIRLWTEPKALSAAAGSDAPVED